MKSYIAFGSTFFGALLAQQGILSFLKEYSQDIYKNYFAIHSDYIIYFAILHALIIAFFVLLVYTKVHNNTIDVQGNELLMYSNQKEAENDILEEIQKSNNIFIFTMRGHSFILPERSFGLLPNERSKNIKFCSANPKTKRNPNIHILNRGAEREDGSPESYWNDYFNDLLRLKKIIKINQNFKCRLHTQPAIFRIMIFDENVYFSFFQKNTIASKMPVYKANNQTAIYAGFKRFFDMSWEESTELKYD